MFLSIKAVAIAVSLLSPPTAEQIHQFLANYQPPVAEVPMRAAANDIEHELFPEHNFSYLPPWETTDMVDPPLPLVTEKTADETADAVTDENVASDDSGPVAPLPAYWVAGTDTDDDTDTAAESDMPSYEDASYSDSYQSETADNSSDDMYGSDDDMYGETYDDGYQATEDYDVANDSYEAEYSEEYYRHMADAEVAATEPVASGPVASEEAASSTATDEQAVAAAASGQSLDSQWFDDAEANIPAPPVADEFHAYDESYVVPSYDDEADDEEAEAVEAEDAVTNQYEPYEELAVASETDETDASVDHSPATTTTTKSVTEPAPVTATDLPIDPALVSVIANWHQLSPESRQAIVALIQQETP